MKLLKYRNIYLFIVFLAFIGFIAGYNYYRIQSDDIKNKIIDNYDINNNLNKRVNNIGKTFINSSRKLIYSITIIPSVINIFNIFYEPFQIGFIFNIFNDHLLFSILFILIYYIIPLIFSLILIKIGFTLSKRLILLLFNYKDRYRKENFKKILLKYMIIFFISIIYEIIIFIASKGINNFLLGLL